MHRFYIPPTEWNPEATTLALGGPEAHHCHDVMRCAVGDQIIAFDGQGTEAVGTITATKKSQVDFSVGSVTRTAPPPARLTLCQAIPKGKNMELVVQKATELGVFCIQPVTSRRVEVRLDEKRRSKRLSHWQGVVISLSSYTKIEPGTTFNFTTVSPIIYIYIVVLCILINRR